MIRTPRLELRPATAAHLRAALDGREALAHALGVAIPGTWPPALYDDDAIRWTLDRLAAQPPERPGFLQYWFVLVEEAERPELVGVGGFKGVPDGGAVELGYEIVPERRRRGIATEVVLGMAGFAFGHDDVNEVHAETLPHLTPSIGVLTKCGFEFAGEGSEPGVIRYLLRRDRWAGTHAVAGRFEEKLALIPGPWSPRRIATVNDTDVKLVKLAGEFVWHRHEREDELFVVLRGRLLMQFRDRDVWVEEGGYILVPRGVEHRPVAPEEVHVMLVEPRGTLNTGNVTDARTVHEVEAI